MHSILVCPHFVSKAKSTLVTLLKSNLRATYEKIRKMKKEGVIKSFLLSKYNQKAWSTREHCLFDGFHSMESEPWIRLTKKMMMPMIFTFLSEKFRIMITDNLCQRIVRFIVLACRKVGELIKQLRSGRLCRMLWPTVNVYTSNYLYTRSTKPIDSVAPSVRMEYLANTIRLFWAIQRNGIGALGFGAGELQWSNSQTRGPGPLCGENCQRHPVDKVNVQWSQWWHTNNSVETKE